jgi:hypothetical protein
MEERRRATRVPLAVPVHVEGHDVDGRLWTEMTKSTDVSLGGLSFTLNHSVDRGSLLHLSVPLPKRFRRYDPVSPSYKVFAIVRDVQGGGPYRWGALYWAHPPPRGHL